MTEQAERDLKQELATAWQTNNRINLVLIERISDEGMGATLSTRGGRDVSRQFAHLHNVRVWHLEKRAKELADGLRKFETAEHPSKRELTEALEASAEAIETFLTDVLTGTPKRRGFKRGIFNSLAYLVSHESHHRGNILLTLKQSGHNLSQADRYRIWAWDQI